VQARLREVVEDRQRSHLGDPGCLHSLQHEWRPVTNSTPSGHRHRDQRSCSSKRPKIAAEPDDARRLAQCASIVDNALQFGFDSRERRPSTNEGNHVRQRRDEGRSSGGFCRARPSNRAELALCTTASARENDAYWGAFREGMGRGSPGHQIDAKNGGGIGSTRSARTASPPRAAKSARVERRVSPGAGDAKCGAQRLRHLAQGRSSAGPRSLNRTQSAPRSGDRPSPRARRPGNEKRRTSQPRQGRKRRRNGQVLFRPCRG